MSEVHFRSGLMALIVFGLLWSQPITGSAQTSVDGEIVGKADAEQYFRDRVAPFLKTYCLECHQNKRPTEAGVNFSPALNSPGHSAFSELWKKAIARVKAHDMPPDYAKMQPAAADRQMFVDWLAKVKFLSPKDPGLFVIRRLTKTEYANTLHDLLGVDPAIASDLPDEVSGAGYLNSLSPLQLEQYLAIANKALDRIVSPEDAKPTEMQRRLFGEPPLPGADARAAASEVARALARKAYRRPPSQAELDVLLEVFDLGRQNELGYSASLRLMLKAILVSPQFLFITPAEAQPGSPGKEPSKGIVRLDEYQLASRLSYLLWATMPDDQLMALADSGKLSEPAILKAQVKRMLEDPRSRALFDGFGAQWLGLESFAGKKFDAAQFPQLTSELRSAMYDEARLFFESIVRTNRSVMSFVESDYTFLNEPLAKVYGLEGTVTGSEMRRVRLSDGNRGGILGMPGILAATSFPNRTSPVKRGVWVLEQVLGEHVPPAPPDIPALDKQDQGKVANLTLRQRTELHRTNAVCANCHQLLDPIGFGLENFDAMGRWRDREENGSVIDASGELPGGLRFTSPKELKAIIAERRDDFSRNLLERLLAYALCRNLEGYDEIVVDGLIQDITADEYRVQTLISAVVTSYPFTHRRIPEAAPKTRTSND
ncbi:DUF1592 domain-containing protein [Anatilimnocola sp. NA78]|uniref:DUF1592 domain-containing protein n=1 Tax=Anatilimnocola sp. NA78 TaxID=3415683 RepID=UPI003CE5605B